MFALTVKSRGLLILNVIVNTKMMRDLMKALVILHAYLTLVVSCIVMKFST